MGAPQPERIDLVEAENRRLREELTVIADAARDIWRRAEGALLGGPDPAPDQPAPE